ncbi:MAG: peptidase domain-containing ABC transporter [Chitinophagaceae bacterium]
MKYPDFKVILQQDQSDCGVACLLSLIQYYGGANNLENLRRLSGTSITGTTLLGLYQAAKECGFDAEGCEADMQSLIEHGEPCILHVLVESNLQHYIVCYGLSARSKAGSEIFLIGDPASGIKELSKDELNRIWQSKRCLTLSPNENFRRSEDIRKQKRRWIKTLIKEDMPILSIAIVLGVGICVLGLVMAIFSQRLIDEILPKKQYLKLNLGIALVLLLLLAKEGLSALRQYFLLRQSKDFNSRVLDFFYSHLLHLPKPFFDTRKIGDLTARLGDTARIQRVISQLAGNMIIDILTVLISSAFVFFYSWKMGIACLLAMPVFFYLVFRFNKRIMDGQRNTMSSYAAVESNYISTLQGIDPIKDNNKQELFNSINKSVYQFYQDKIVLLGKIQIKLSFIANSFAVLFLTGVLFFCGYSVLNNELETGELIAVLGICGALLPAVANLALLAIPVNEAKIAFDRMFEFTGIEKEKETEKNESFLFDSIEIRNLAFRFPGHRRILNDISFSVSKGEIIAIMGENGCGKSTLLQLLQKKYDSENGKIIINKISHLQDIDLTLWRNVVATMPQHVHIFNGTVLNNIAFDDAVKNPEKVLRFLQETGLSEMIDALPQSYMTIVGEEGINLSGGQKQIIALARALYHQPQLLILDEATSAMDRKTELFVLELLKKLKVVMGIIFVTHRLHVLKNFCDRIYILEDGCIAAEGDHNDLLSTQNLYSNYWADVTQ